MSTTTEKISITESKRNNGLYEAFSYMVREVYDRWNRISNNAASVNLKNSTKALYEHAKKRLDNQTTCPEFVYPIYSGTGYRKWKEIKSDLVSYIHCIENKLWDNHRKVANPDRYWKAVSVFENSNNRTTLDKDTCYALRRLRRFAVEYSGHNIVILCKGDKLELNLYVKKDDKYYEQSIILPKNNVVLYTLAKWLYSSNWFGKAYQCYIEGLNLRWPDYDKR